MTNEEMLLTALANGATINPKFQPQNNKQAYLAYLCGLEIDLPAPRTAEEALMRLLCENGGAGGSEDGGIDVALTEQEALIAELQDALKGKASGGGSVSAPLIVDSFGEEGLLGSKGRCTGITIGEGVTRIGQWAFEAYTALTSVTIPEGVTDIEVYAFYGCESLESVTFKGTPAIIQGEVFYECTNLTTINVPWAEGEVAGAPWSAENATINYNYSEE